MTMDEEPYGLKLDVAQYCEHSIEWLYSSCFLAVFTSAVAIFVYCFSNYSMLPLEWLAFFNKFKLRSKRAALPATFLYDLEISVNELLAFEKVQPVSGKVNILESIGETVDENIFYDTSDTYDMAEEEDWEQDSDCEDNCDESSKDDVASISAELEETLQIDENCFDVEALKRAMDSPDWAEKDIKFNLK